MVTERARIDTLAAGQAQLADTSGADESVLVVAVGAQVPDWLATLVAEAGRAGATVVVEAQAPNDLKGEALDGWEIGVCTAALAAGTTDVIGIDPYRVARVREVEAALGVASPATQTGEPVA